MLIGYCPRCMKAGMKYGDGSIPAKIELMRAGQRYCPRCKVWERPCYLVSAKRKERLKHR